MNPQLFTAFNNRGNAWRDKGDNDKAIGDFNEAIRLNPQFAAALLFRGLTHEVMNNLEIALTDFKNFARLEPSSPIGQKVIMGIEAKIDARKR